MGATGLVASVAIHRRTNNRLQAPMSDQDDKLYLRLPWNIFITKRVNPVWDNNHCRTNSAVPDEESDMQLGRLIRICIQFWRHLRTFHRIRIQGNAQSLDRAAQALADTLIESGPAFIKIGQILSTRPDFMHPAYIQALSRLHEHVPAVPYPDIERVLKRSFDNDLDSLFRKIEPRPVATASLAQVHFAELVDGTPVAIKVIKPGVAGRIDRDLRLMDTAMKLLNLFARRTIRRLGLDNAYAEFRRYTVQELDMKHEAATLQRFRNNFRDYDGVDFPRVYHAATAADVLTMERVEGLRLSAVRNRLSEEARLALTRRVIRTLIKMFVEDAFFHADLHPGNIFFEESGNVQILDVGMYGELTPEQRDRFLIYWFAIVQREKKRAFHHLSEIAERTDWADPDGFYREYDETLEAFYQATISERSLTQTYVRILMLGARYGYRFPPEMFLQAKALTTAENLAFVLMPEFRFADEARDFVIDYMGDRMTESAIASRLERSAPEWLLLGETLPPAADDGESDASEFWKLVGKSAARRVDRFKREYDEVWHGASEVVINQRLDKVFNFVTRFAQYTRWHPTYTGESKVIHVSGQYIFLTPEVIGSVFRLDEVVDGYHLLSNGKIIEFERNKKMKWHAPFSLLPYIQLGTCLEFEKTADGRTRLSEYFFFSESLVKYTFIDRRWFSVEALSAHIHEELSGVKRLIESGDYDPGDTAYLWDGLTDVVRLDGDGRYPLRPRPTLPTSSTKTSEPIPPQGALL